MQRDVLDKNIRDPIVDKLSARTRSHLGAARFKVREYTCLSFGIIIAKITTNYRDIPNNYPPRSVSSFLCNLRSRILFTCSDLGYLASENSSGGPFKSYIDLMALRDSQP